jgi:hypothetical protein
MSDHVQLLDLEALKTCSVYFKANLHRGIAGRVLREAGLRRGAGSKGRPVYRVVLPQPRRAAVGAGAKTPGDQGDGLLRWVFSAGNLSKREHRRLPSVCCRCELPGPRMCHVRRIAGAMRHPVPQRFFVCFTSAVVEWGRGIKYSDVLVPAHRLKPCMIPDTEMYPV